MDQLIKSLFVLFSSQINAVFELTRIKLINGSGRTVFLNFFLSPILPGHIIPPTTTTTSLSLDLIARPSATAAPVICKKLRGVTRARRVQAFF